MKKLLIISPYFPPLNTPDSQRIRMSVPYYNEMGWDPVVLTVDPTFVEGFTDSLLEKTLPLELEIHYVKAWNAKWTRKFGISSLSIRSFFFFLKGGNRLLKKHHFDLIFFSTTAFHVCVLGYYWKKKFGVPFIIDLQDPWRNDHYLKKPKSQRPPKFWFAYNLDKILEAITMPHLDGLMTVSLGYISMIKNRYSNLTNLPAEVIPFGATTLDFELVEKKAVPPFAAIASDQRIKVVYVGAVTPFFLPLLEAFFLAFIETMPRKNIYHFYFIGTNYSKNKGRQSIAELAASLGLNELVTEIPERISYFSALATLKTADILFVPGSTDIHYNASKIYNYILAGKPIFSIFHKNSLVKKIIEEAKAGIVIGIDGQESIIEIKKQIINKMHLFKDLHSTKIKPDTGVVESFSARERTKEQVSFFNKVVSKYLKNQ